MEKNTPEKVALLAVRFALGIFFIFEGLDKLPWMIHPDQLADALRKWADNGVPLSKWYIDTFLLPGVPVFARLVFLGEVGAGLAFFFGVWVRPVAVLTFLMVLNIHFAHSSIFHYGFLAKGDGLPILGGLLALAIAGHKLPLSLSSSARGAGRSGGSRKRK